MFANFGRITDARKVLTEYTSTHPDCLHAEWMLAKLPRIAASDAAKGTAWMPLN